MVNELLRLCSECNLFSRLTIILCAELTSAGSLDPVYATNLLKFLRDLISKSSKEVREKVLKDQDAVGNLLQLARTLLLTLPQPSEKLSSVKQPKL